MRGNDIKEQIQVLTSGQPAYPDLLRQIKDHLMDAGKELFGIVKSGDIGEDLDILDFERAGKIAGTRFTVIRSLGKV